MARKLFWARRPLGYGGVEYDRGQVLELGGLINDEKLVRLGYVAPLEERAKTYPCRECGKEFVEMPMRDAHGDKRHIAGPLDPLEEDERAEREERMLSQAAPLYLDKTTASRA